MPATTPTHDTPRRPGSEVGSLAHDSAASSSRTPDLIAQLRHGRCRSLRPVRPCRCARDRFRVCVLSDPRVQQRRGASPVHARAPTRSARASADPRSPIEVGGAALRDDAWGAATASGLSWFASPWLAASVELGARRRAGVPPAASRRDRRRAGDRGRCRESMRGERFPRVRPLETTRTSCFGFVRCVVVFPTMIWPRTLVARMKSQARAPIVTTSQHRGSRARRGRAHRSTRGERDLADAGEIDRRHGNR